jgi:hypothetical protein
MGSFDFVRLAPHFARDDSVSHNLGMTVSLMTSLSIFGACHSDGGGGRISPSPQSPITLHIVKQRHKSKIHVQLLVTVKQRQARIISHEIHFRRLVAAQHQHVFHHARH